MPTRPLRRRREDEHRGQGQGSRVQGREEKRTAGIIPAVSFSTLYPLPCPLDPAFQSVKIAEAYVTALEVAASR